MGSQLADVFLHLLPEAFAHPEASSINIGLWTLIGLFVFFIIEQIFPEDQNDSHLENSIREVFYLINKISFSLNNYFRMKIKKKEKSK